MSLYDNDKLINEIIYSQSRDNLITSAHLLDRLLHPIIEKKELQRRYDMIERFKEPVHNPVLFQYKIFR